jgi:hypothetical protein
VADAAGAPVGLAFYGRGYDVRIVPPFDRPLLEALGQAAEACVAACPTAALRWQTDADAASLPVLSQNPPKDNPVAE